MSERRSNSLLIRRCLGGEGLAYSLPTSSYFPDSSFRMASGSGDRTVRFWDISTQTPLFTCQGHDSSVLFVAWSPDGKYLVSGSESGELICWDPQTGKSLGRQENEEMD
ncbi:hypothetical protein P8452_01808 [Trifolium repens]|nr:hypothetical protein P8452_01808 [Trifolium repens]